MMKVMKKFTESSEVYKTTMLYTKKSYVRDSRIKDNGEPWAMKNKDE